MHLFVILFFNLLKTTQYLAHTYIKHTLAIAILQYSNILQYAIYRYSLSAILYCIDIAIYQYINVLFHPYYSQLVKMHAIATVMISCDSRAVEAIVDRYGHADGSIARSTIHACYFYRNQLLVYPKY